jgi:DNA-binding MarR family transcriptional regulator
MPARPDPAQLSAWRRLLEAHATVTELLEHELVAERGLPLSRYDVLLNLAEAPEGRLRMQELSASVLLSKSGLSRLVDRMVEAGLVRRERCQDDRRGWFAVLTDQGRPGRAAGAGPRAGLRRLLITGAGSVSGTQTTWSTRRTR